MSTASRLAILAGVALLAVVVAAVLLLGGEDSVGRQAPATATPAGSLTAGSPTPLSSAAVAAEFGDIERQVLEIRGLEAPDIGPAEVITRDQLAVELEEMLDAEWTEEELRRSNVTLRAMGLLDEGQDLRELTEELLGGQVIGFYDPLEQRMVVVSDEGLSTTARITYAHEYDHALQDANFDTFEARDDLADDDAILALQALEEGDAVAVMFDWGMANLTPAELLGLGSQPVPDMSGIPGWMVSQLLFPYNNGFTFVSALRGAEGDWSAVNDAYTDRPASTEQIIHPEKYLAGEDPIAVEAPGMAARLGGGWADLEPTTMGEAMLDFWLVELGADVSAPSEAAAGWGGDRLSVAEGADGEWLMTWRIAWDTAADADEFVAAHDGLQPGGDISAALIRASKTETVVIHASSDEVLAAATSILR